MNLKMAIPFHEEQHQKTIEGTVILIPKVRSPMCTFKSTLKGRDLSFQDGFFFSIQTISSASSEPLFLFTNSRTRPWTVAVSRCNKTTKLTPYLQGSYLQMRQKKRFKTSTPPPPKKRTLKISFKERFV